MSSEQRQPEPPQWDNAECTVPGPVSPEALAQYSLRDSAYDGADSIRDYVEGQSPDETVTYLERMSTERVAGHDHEVWDVHTTGERYWVITNATNFYSQRLFPSADYTLSFHVGLMARIASRREAADVEHEQRLSGPWRRWAQAGEALDRAHEAEEFQAVGMRCREALVALVKELASPTMVPAGAEAPKAADFIHWAELIADALASGPSAREVRGYLKTTSRATWQLVSWLTHAASAGRLDAEIAVEATQKVLTTMSFALLRFERGTPDRCPACASYKLGQRYMPELGDSNPYATVCATCGWSNAPAPNGE